MICAEKLKQGIAMHFFDNTYLKDDLLPVQLVSPASNISSALTTKRRSEEA